MKVVKTNISVFNINHHQIQPANSKICHFHIARGGMPGLNCLQFGTEELTSKLMDRLVRDLAGPPEFLFLLIYSPCATCALMLEYYITCRSNILGFHILFFLLPERFDSIGIPGSAVLSYL
ncbi:hypothetical protein ACJX0J_023350, partial [Zea mays]